jgi:DNA-directed RNA polymerase specialized sigma24 family protein
MTSIPNHDPTRLLADLDFVRSLARQLCRDEHAAEDVAQETLAEAIAKPPTREGNWRGWLATVTRNFARKHHCKERRLKDRETQVSSNAPAVVLKIEKR